MEKILLQKMKNYIIWLKLVRDWLENTGIEYTDTVDDLIINILIIYRIHY